MPRALDDVIRYLNDELKIKNFRDYGPNGLQVEGRPEIRMVATGVSASMALFEKARALKADLVVVHHGLIWGSGIERVTGSMKTRLAYLLEHEISLAAYHLPLDAHRELGNNAGLADAIGLQPEHTCFGNVRGHALGLAGTFDRALTRDEVVERVGKAVCSNPGKAPRFVFPYGPDRVTKVGLCTGAASDLLEDASRAGCDLFITGELAERAGEIARELKITLIAAGHADTEIFGPKRVCNALAQQFSDLSVHFVDVESPL